MPVEWEAMPFPGRASLERRVARAIGPGSRFGGLRNRLADWIEDGPEAPARYVNEVEAEIAGYFARAARVGKVWGTVVGFTFGLVASAVLGGAAWLWVLLR